MTAELVIQLALNARLFQFEALGSFIERALGLLIYIDYFELRCRKRKGMLIDERYVCDVVIGIALNLNEV